MEHTQAAARREPWNKGKIVGQKAPFKVKDIWALRVRLQMERRVRELALFNLGIDSKLRGCDLVKLKVRDVCHTEHVAARAIVMQQKTQRPVQFEITPATREAAQAWIEQAGLRSDDFLFPSRVHDSPHLGTRQYARILEGWVEELGLDTAAYGTHSTPRTKPTMIYRRTKNLRAVQLLLGHTKLDYVPCRTMSSTLDPAQGDGGGMPDIVGPSLRALEERRLACSLAVGAKACRPRAPAFPCRYVPRWSPHGQDVKR